MMNSKTCRLMVGIFCIRMYLLTRTESKRLHGEHKTYIVLTLVDD